MPNWVSNSLSIEGSEETIKAIKEQLSRPIKVKGRENGSDNLIEKEITPTMSFMNIVSPPADKLDEYYETNGTHKDPTTGEMVRTGDTEWNWYNFNNREWGTKWDIHNETFLYENLPTSLGYSFQTAWSPPLPAIEKLAKQHPSATISISYEEEQGWGGVIRFQGDTQEIIQEYDIPESHAQMIEIKDYCPCQDASSPADLPFSDCAVVING